MVPDYFTAKLASMIGGLFGGAAILTFIKPQSVGEAFVRGGVSVGSAMVFAVPLLDAFHLDNNWENQLMAGFCVGFLAYSMLGMVANFLVKHKNGTIVDAANDIRGKNDHASDKSNESNILRNGRRASDPVITINQENNKGN